MNNLRIISEDDVASVLTMAELIPCMADALVAYSRGEFAQPVRTIIGVPGHGGFFGAMPAASATGLGSKLVAFYPSNTEKGIDSHQGLIALFDPETGVPTAIMDGRLITEMRTAAVTAAFIDAAAPPEIRTFAMLGAGLQGSAHIEALRCVRDIDEIRIWNRTAERAERLAEETGAVVASSCREAVEDADVVVTATAATRPIIDGDWLKPGARLASVGFGGFDGGELDEKTMRNTVVVDYREGALAEPKHVKRFNAEIYAELGEVIAGDKPLSADETVVFDSLGMACEDIASAALVLQKLG